MGGRFSRPASRLAGPADPIRKLRLIPDSFKHDLLNRVDIVDLIERYVRLKKTGANYSACCPFHNEKTPSFTVSPSKQFYHCFGCGAHGNAISFLMEYSGLGYVEAVKDLAESTGMKMPEFEKSPQTREPDGPDLYELLQRAMQYYREQLKSSPAAVAYLKGRGLTGRVAAHFGIGYAPAGWQNLEAVFPDYADKALRDCGLVIDAEGGRRYDRFRDRIMFPILNQRGSVIGFGGRVLGEGEPKYLNSPETPLFEKGRELYGLAQARTAIREAGRVIVVEGYMDVVALAQHGVENAVATLGTATSAAHVQKLLRQTDEIVFCFDGDAAGRRAAWHALDVSLALLADHKAVKFLFLPSEDDPDSYIRARGSEAFARALSGALPLSEFFLTELKGHVDTGTLEGRSRLVHEAKPLLKRVAAPALQLQLLKRIADAAGISQDEAARLTELRGQVPYAGSRPAPARGPDRAMLGLDGNMERQILKCLLAHPALVRNLPADLDDMLRPEGRTISALAGVHAIEELSHPAILEVFRDTEHQAVVERVSAELIAERLDAEMATAVFFDAMRKIEIARLDSQISSLTRKAAAGEEGVDSSAIQDLVTRREVLRREHSRPPNVI